MLASASAEATTAPTHLGCTAGVWATAEDEASTEAGGGVGAGVEHELAQQDIANVARRLGSEHDAEVRRWGELTGQGKMSSPYKLALVGRLSKAIASDGRIQSGMLTVTALRAAASCSRA